MAKPQKETADGGKYTKGQRSPRWAFMQTLDILAKDGSGDVYLHRLRILQTPMFGIYLHDLNLPDADRDPHDHPWNFYSVILRGGYTERYYPHPTATLKNYRVQVWKRWSIHRMGRLRAHQIDSVEPKTISLIFVGRRARNWGFHTPTGWVPWEEYV